MTDNSPSFDAVKLTVDGFVLLEEDQYIDAFEWAILPDFGLCIRSPYYLIGLG